MTSPRRLDETKLQDGKGGEQTVRPGAQVELLPPPSQEDTSDGAYFARQTFDDQLRRLGDGPYQVSWIGQWPCGRVMLYLKTRSGEPGVYAKDFVAA